MLEVDGPRTIVTIGDRLEPDGGDELDWDRLEAADGVYFTAGDSSRGGPGPEGARARHHPRAREALESSPAAIDALVFSGSDEDEQRWARRLQTRTKLMVETEGGRGGRWWGRSEGRWLAGGAARSAPG